MPFEDRKIADISCSPWVLLRPRPAATCRTPTLGDAGGTVDAGLVLTTGRGLNAPLRGCWVAR